MTSLLAFSDTSILGIELTFVLKLLVTLYSAALFMQSGLDKVFDWKGNRDFINGMFEKTILKPFVPLLMPSITILEVLAGLLLLAGAVMLIFKAQDMLAIYGLLLGALSILLLFFGMRIAKDYGGAAGITPYFVFFVIALALFA
ncbi:MAG: DoxX family protein [Saprospiraceae bacterium]